MNNLQIIEVVTETAHMQPLDLIKEAKKGNMSSSPLLAGAPYSDAQMLVEINLLQTLYDKTQLKPPTEIKLNVDKQFNILARKYKKNGNFLKGVANDEAVLEGDVNAGLAIVSAAGYKAKKAKASVAKGFKGDSTIAKQADITNKAVKRVSAYLYQYAGTPDKDVTPTAVAIAKNEIISSPTVSVSIKNCKDKIIAVRTAVVVKAPRKKRGGTSLPPINSTQRAASPTAGTSAHTTVFIDGEENYSWSGWIYITIKQ